jgi:hypothetical protein
VGTGGTLSRTIGFWATALYVLAPFSVAAQFAIHLTAWLTADLRVTGESQPGATKPPSLLDFDA